MSISPRNKMESFILKQVTAQLTTDGYSEAECAQGVGEAIKHYRTCGSVGNGKAFDTCLAKARQLLSPAKKSATKRKRKQQNRQQTIPM